MFLTYSQIRKKRRDGFIQPLQALEEARGIMQNTLQTARLFEQIQKNLCQFLKQELGMHCHVVRLEEEKLVLAVPNAALASKLRQLAPSIAQHLAQHGYNIQQLNIKIHASLNPKTSTVTAYHQSLSRDNRTKHRHQQFKKAFAQLLRQEPNSPLAPTLKRLLKD